MTVMTRSLPLSYKHFKLKKSYKYQLTVFTSHFNTRVIILQAICLVMPHFNLEILPKFMPLTEEQIILSFKNCSFIEKYRFDICVLIKSKWMKIFFQ